VEEEKEGKKKKEREKVAFFRLRDASWRLRAIDLSFSREYVLSLHNLRFRSLARGP